MNDKIDQILTQFMNKCFDYEGGLAVDLDTEFNSTLAAITALVEEAKKEVATNALIIAEYWLEEDGRPKHLIQDLVDVEDISVLDHIDDKYIARHRPLQPKQEEEG